MKLDILKGTWLEIVFEGRNKSYGAYELRKENPKTTLRAMVIGAVIFIFLLASPLIASWIPKSEKQDDDVLDQKIVTVKLPPKEKIPENLPPPPPPPPKVDQVKFTKPEVAKAADVVEEPPKIVDIKEKKVGDKDIKGDPDAVLTVEPVGTGPSKVVEEDPNKIYSTAGIEVQPDFPGGIAKFYKFIQNNFTPPDEPGISGTVYVAFVVERDGSLTDIRVTRDVGYGSKEEALRVMKKAPRWIPGEQNGKKVRVSFSIPIKIKSAD